MPAFVQRLPFDHGSTSSAGHTQGPRASQVRAALVLVTQVSPDIHPVLQFAAAFCDDVTAVYVDDDPAETRRFAARWAQSGATAPLVVLDGNPESHLDPLAAYIENLGLVERDEVMVVVPEKEYPRGVRPSGAPDLDLCDLNRDYCPISGLPRIPGS